MKSNPVKDSSFRHVGIDGPRKGVASSAPIKSLSSTSLSQRSYVVHVRNNSLKLCDACGRRMSAEEGKEDWYTSRNIILEYRWMEGVKCSNMRRTRECSRTLSMVGSLENTMRSIVVVGGGEKYLG